MQETTNLKLKKPQYNEYADIADINYNMDIIDREINKKLDEDAAKFVQDKGLPNGSISKEIFGNPAYTQSYIGAVNYGQEVSLPTSYCKIIYIPNQGDGYGTQIAIPYDSGIFTTMYIRNATSNTWGAWNDMRSLGNAENNAYRNTYNANTAIESGKLYYCTYNQCQNLPRGTADDGILIPYMHRTDVLYGYQIYMSWNNDSLWTRNVINNTFTAWRCISGGKWNSEIISDSTQVHKFLRWENYGQNHIIFDASKSIRPDGKSCNNTNPDNHWSATLPTIMGFNGNMTYGVRVDSSRVADIATNANMLQGFQFRNNNGKLEVLVGGVWLSVGAKQYTVVRQGKLTFNEQFNYAGSSGVIRVLKHYSNYQTVVEVFVDGQKITPIVELDGTGVYSAQYFLKNIEFKNSVSIRVGQQISSSQYFTLDYIIQTEK